MNNQVSTKIQSEKKRPSEISYELEIAHENGDYEQFLNLLFTNSRINKLSEKIKDILKRAILRSNELESKEFTEDKHIVLGENKKVIINTTKNENNFRLGEVTIDDTDPDDIKKIWNSIIFSVEKMNIKDDSITIIASPKIFGK